MDKVGHHFAPTRKYRRDSSVETACHMSRFPAALALVVSATSFVAAKVTFNRDVLPILSNNCFACHGPDSATREAGLRLDREENAKKMSKGIAAIVAGDPEASEMIQRIQNDDPDDLMPPPDSRRQLTEREKTILSEWIKEGAKWEKHWAFVTPKSPPVPAAKDPAWPVNAIDHFILKTLTKKKLTPSAPASKEKILRRVTLDLTGLPPTLAEREAFLRDTRSDAYERVVDRLLVSPRYGETMALPWLEAARFADTDGYQYDGPRIMWPWRDWVINAYNANKPFDQFTIEQLAGDLLPDSTLDQKIATGFNRNHRYNSEAGLVPEEFLLENAVDRVDTTSTVWLGLTMGCARCHDHKYDPLSQENYYQMLAFFNNVPEAGRAVKGGNSEPYLPAPTVPQRKELARLDAEIASLVEELEPALKTTDGLPVESRPDLVLQGLNYRHPDSVLTFKEPKSVKIPDTPLGKNKKGPSRFEIFSPLKRYSVSLWIKPTQTGKGTIISRQAGNNERGNGMNLRFRDGHLQFSVVTRWIAGVAMVETKEKLPANQWSHVTITFHGQLRASNQHIFVNGREAPLNIIHNTNSNTGSAKKGTPLQIGGYPSDAFQGEVRNVRVYQRPLRDREILTLSETASLQEITALSETKRTAAQKAKLKTALMEHGPAKATYQKLIAARTKRDDYIRKLPTTMVMVERPESKETFVRRRGVYNDYGKKVSRDVPEIFPEFPKDAPRNRLGLAQWIVSPENPLTARVTVNRYWQKYFGTGLVKTTEDFGVQGEKPSHPELLDWLATEFVRSGWDVKHLQKLIVTSATYRQQSNLTPKLLEVDPYNRLLARGPRQRLPGHVIRDQALALSGLLVERIGGPSVSPYQPANLWIEMSMGMRYKPSQGDNLFRRSLYTIWKRTVNPPAMAILDAADREACWVGVKRTNTPLQALTLLNETAFVESARKLAERTLRESPKDPVTHAFRLVTQREPRPDEKEILSGALEEYLATFRADSESAKALTRIGSSEVPKDLDPVKLAAHTALANVLLNLDEVITKE